MADSQEPVCEAAEVPRGTNEAGGGGGGGGTPPPLSQTSVTEGEKTEGGGGGGGGGGGNFPRDRLEEEDQASALWEKEEEREEEEGEEEEEADDTDTTGDEEEVDPRVAENLEIMNHSCAEVNRLENELDEARSKYRSTFQASSQRMEELGSKMKKTIQRARHYFDLTEQAKQAQNEALRAARQYQTANGNYRAAVEMVTLAEKGLDDTSTKTRTLSSAWQETLNHAVERVTEAEREKRRSEAEHNSKAAICAQLESRLHFLEKKYKRSIAKARPYFETKAELELKLQQLKQNVSDLQQAISIRKTRYAEALRCLEAVSTEIHESRRSRKKMLLQFPREPGVGAETDSLGSSISDSNIERGVFSTSTFSPDEEDDDDDDDDDELDDVGDTFSAGRDVPRRKPSRSLSRRSTSKQADTDDCRSLGSRASGSVFSRSVSSGSVFSSEGHNDSASESPCSPTAAPVAPCYPALDKVSTTSSGTTPSLMDVARGDLGCRQVNHVGKGQSPDATTGDRCGTATGAQDSAEDVKDLADCEREAGDGSAQEDCPLEPDSSRQAAVSAQSSLCSQFSSGLAPSPPHHHQSAQGVSQPQELPVKAAVAQLVEEGVKTGGTIPVSGEVKKMPLRRTDAPAHRPLQGVMLLNPSDLAATSFHFGPRM